MQKSARGSVIYGARACVWEENIKMLRNKNELAAHLRGFMYKHLSLSMTKYLLL